MRRIAGLFILLILTGCNQASIDPSLPRPQKLKDRIPQSELTCMDRPDGRKVRTNRQVARFIVDLDEAGQDCRDRLNTTRELIEQEK